MLLFICSFCLVGCSFGFHFVFFLFIFFHFWFLAGVMAVRPCISYAQLCTVMTCSHPQPQLNTNACSLWICPFWAFHINGAYSIWFMSSHPCFLLPVYFGCGVWQIGLVFGVCQIDSIDFQFWIVFSLWALRFCCSYPCPLYSLVL